MSQASCGITTSEDSAEAAVANVRRLLQHLPWLPAYDRRDVLVVHKLLALDHLVPPPSARTYQVLALTAYFAAWQYPSAGDQIVSAGALTPLRTWLRQRNIHITMGRDHESSSISFSEFEESSGAGLIQADSGKGVGSGGLTWLDGCEVSTAREEACLKLKDLRQSGWRVIPGASCALLTPLGAVYLAPPSGGRWALIAVLHVRHWHASTILCYSAMFLSMGTNGFAWATVYFITYKSPATLNMWALDIVLIVIQVVRLCSTFALMLLFLRADSKVALAGRVPLPLVAFNSAAGNVAVACLCALAVAYWISQSMLALDEAGVHWGGEIRNQSWSKSAQQTRAAANALGGVANALIAALSAQTLLLSTIVIVSASVLRGWAQHDVLG